MAKRTARHIHQQDKVRKVTEAKKNELAKLYATGQWSMRKLAKHIGVSLSVVWRHVEELRQKWREDRNEQIDTIKQRELAKVDLLEEEALAAWERSQDDEVKVETEFADKKTGKKSKETRVGQAGDPRFLQQIERCIKSRREILGLDAPTKSEQQISGNMAYAMLTPDQLKQEILSRLEKPGAASDESITPATENDDG
jgi:biotin operon repressor